MTTPDSHSDSSPEPAPLPARFNNKTAIVTGVNDRGIGAAIAMRLAREGARVAAFGLDEPTRTINRIAKTGRAMLWRKVDVRDSAAINAFVAEVAAELGAIDVLVNNAGIDLSAPLVESSDEAIRRLIDVNLMGAIQTTKATLPQLRSPGGVVVNIASATALGGNAEQSIYSASKSALLGFTHSLALELRQAKQRVVAVAPGTVLTPMSRQYMGNTNKQGMGEVIARADRSIAALPLGVGLPEDVANAVAFLASDEARWISGVVLPIGYCSMYAQPLDRLES
ncbi:MAG: SDR family oxidoreductase [Planctomycetales bacterium]|nr:SDR family oxidoreductase [Planctomycetales bacterium]